MELLPHEVRKSGYLFTQLWRDEDYAIYVQNCTLTGEIHSYEAFRIKKSEPRLVKLQGVEVLFSAKEHYPTDEDFGVTAFSCHRLERTMRIINQIKKREVVDMGLTKVDIEKLAKLSIISKVDLNRMTENNNKNNRSNAI